MLLILLACAADPGADTASAPAWVAPDAVGPWLVGTDEAALTGQTGTELTVQVWFPAASTGDDVYRYDDWVAAEAMERGLPACDTVRPVVLFSHGYGGVRYQSTFLTERLASQGFVVVAPDHTDNTMFDLEEAQDGEVAFRRPLDIADSFDWLVEQAEPGGPFEGCVDPDAGYAVVGHSFGGWTALAVAGATVDPLTAKACANGGSIWCDVYQKWVAVHGDDPLPPIVDPRAWASVSMCPGGFEIMGATLADIDAPVLVMGGTLDDTTPWDSQVQPIYGELDASPRYLGGVVGAGHFTFSDLCTMVPVLPECDGPEAGYVDIPQALALIDTVSAAFLRTTLGDSDAGAWLPPESDVLLWEEGE
jgi:predicted dienelactone hydrolase